MRWQRALSVTGTVAILVVAVVGALLFIPQTKVDGARLARLGPTQAPTGYKSKTSGASVVPSSQSPFPIVKSVAKRNPHATASYSWQWVGASSSSDGASMIATVLPNPSDAATAVSQATKTFLSSAGFTSGSYKFHSRFSIAGVTGPAGALFTPASSSGKEYLATFAERYGRVAVLAFIDQSGGLSKVQSTAVSLARAESAHLHSAVAGLTITYQRWPVGLLAGYAAGAAVIAALPLCVPVLLRRSRRRRRASRQAVARRQVMGRGGKIAKRQAAPRR